MHIHIQILVAHTYLNASTINRLDTTGRDSKICALVKSWVWKWVSMALAPARNCCTTGKPNFRARGTTPTALHTLQIDTNERGRGVHRQ